jgi:adenylate cyclase
MPQEIERKYLVTGDGWKRLATSSQALAQGYIANTPQASVRVRIADGGGAAWLSVKSAVPGTTRQEFEYAIPVAEARELLRLASGAVINKTRHHVPVGAHVFEVDVFEGENTGLTVAEVELDSEHENIALPDWIGAEVSHDRRYYNAALSAHPFTRWTQS